MHPRITHLHYEPNEPTIPVGRWSRRSLYQQIYPRIEQKASVRKKRRNMRYNKYFLKVVPSTTTLKKQQGQRKICFMVGTCLHVFYDVLAPLKCSSWLLAGRTVGNDVDNWAKLQFVFDTWRPSFFVCMIHSPCEMNMKIYFLLRTGSFLYWCRRDPKYGETATQARPPPT